jgi:hypothetical protein
VADQDRRHLAAEAAGTPSRALIGVIEPALIVLT